MSTAVGADRAAFISPTAASAEFKFTGGIGCPYDIPSINEHVTAQIRSAIYIQFARRRRRPDADAVSAVRKICIGARPGPERPARRDGVHVGFSGGVGVGGGCTHVKRAREAAGAHYIQLVCRRRGGDTDVAAICR